MDTRHNKTGDDIGVGLYAPIRIFAFCVACIVYLISTRYFYPVLFSRIASDNSSRAYLPGHLANLWTCGGLYVNKNLRFPDWCEAQVLVKKTLPHICRNWKSGECPEPWGLIPTTLDEVDVWLMSTTSTRVSFRYSLFKFWRAILSIFAGNIFFFVFYQLCKQSLNIDIAPVLLEFYFTFPDWTRQHPATNDGTLHGVPFISTSQYLQAQLATFFHRAKRVTVFLDNYWRIKSRQSNDFIYTNVMWVSVASC